MTAAKSLSRNHIELSNWHIGLAVFYAVAIGAAVLFSPPLRKNMDYTFTLLALPSLIHLALAWGSRMKSEISRRISIFIGFLMFFAFPIGTFVAMFFFLRLTDWEPAPSLDLQKTADRS
jgi:hypothetical protein